MSAQSLLERAKQTHYVTRWAQDPAAVVRIPFAARYYTEVESQYLVWCQKWREPFVFLVRGPEYSAVAVETTPYWFGLSDPEQQELRQWLRQHTEDPGLKGAVQGRVEVNHLGARSLRIPNALVPWIGGELYRVTCAIVAPTRALRVAHAACVLKQVEALGGLVHDIARFDIPDEWREGPLQPLVQAIFNHAPEVTELVRGPGSWG